MVRLSDLINSHEQYELAKAKLDLTLAVHYGVLKLDIMVADFMGRWHE